MPPPRFNSRQALIPLSIILIGVSSLLFLYLYLGKEPVAEVDGLRKDLAETLGGIGLWALILIYGRSLLKLTLNEGTILQRLVPDEHYDLSLSAAKKLLVFLNRTHKYVGAIAIVVMAPHALLVGAIRWNPFLIAVLCLLAWQGLFGLFLVIRLPPQPLKRYGHLAHAQLFTGVMIGVFAGFGHLLV